MRVCNVCKVEQPLENFHNCKSFSLGKTYSCKLCAKAKSIAWNFSNKEKKKDAGRKHYLENKQDYVDRAAIANWQGKNLEKAKAAWKKRYQEYNSKYVAKLAERRAKRLQATPSWLSLEQKQEIKSIYDLAFYLSKESGEKYHVDHIIPLQGKSVCGLHVPWNLQPLLAKTNIAKYNKYPAFEDQSVFGY